MMQTDLRVERKMDVKFVMVFWLPGTIILPEMSFRKYIVWGKLAFRTGVSKAHRKMTF